LYSLSTGSATFRIPIAVVESDGDRCRVIENAEKRHDFESAGNESSEVRSE
jgi:hypothetical protein